MNDAIKKFTSAANCWFLSGPTASGKTKVALELAARINAEIISMDSMAIYREMNIGTAKPTAAQRALVPHHLIDIVNPDEEFSLAEYADAAHVQIEDIRRRGKQALLVGGTPLYLKAMLRGLFQGPPPDWDFRRAVAEEVASVGCEALHHRLAQVDPLSAAWLHPHDQRRIIRALEVYKVTGRPLSHMQTQFDQGRPAEQCKVFVLDWPRPTLHERINARVDCMFAGGLVDEVRGLLDRWQQFSRTARQAVGYREAIEFIRGECQREQTIDKVQVRTRRFAKRQLTWFRHLSECRFIPMDSLLSPTQVAERIIKSCNP